MRPSVVFVVIALLAVIVLTRSARMVPVQRNDIVERFGKYHRTLTPGMHVVWPFLDRILGTVDLREQLVTVPPEPFTTARGDAVTLSLNVYVRVIDATKFAYAGPFLPALEDRLTATVQTIVGGYDTGPALNQPTQIAMAVTEKLDDALKPWAAKVTRVEITDVKPPPPKDGKGWVYRKVA
jgi:regulator of protease activity HflC (stomatin/prohibitin superfamily)